MPGHTTHHDLSQPPLPCPDHSFLGIADHMGKRLEVAAFGISYIGTLQGVDLEAGTIILSDDNGIRAILELERVDSYNPVSTI